MKRETVNTAPSAHIYVTGEELGPDAGPDAVSAYIEELSDALVAALPGADVRVRHGISACDIDEGIADVVCGIIHRVFSAGKWNELAVQNP